MLFFQFTKYCNKYKYVGKLLKRTSQKVVFERSCHTEMELVLGQQKIQGRILLHEVRATGK